jgi:hypothetical protein
MPAMRVSSGIFCMMISIKIMANEKANPIRIPCGVLEIW